MDPPFASVENPWARHLGPSSRPFGLLAATVSNALVVAAALSLVVRMRRAEGEARRQLRWIAIAAVPVAALLVIAFVAAYTGPRGAPQRRGCGNRGAHPRRRRSRRHSVSPVRRRPDPLAGRHLLDRERPRDRHLRRGGLRRGAGDRSGRGSVTDRDHGGDTRRRRRRSARVRRGARCARSALSATALRRAPSGARLHRRSGTQPQDRDRPSRGAR